MSTIAAICRQVCPRCRRGPIFALPLWRGVFAMNETCPVCGLRFEREPGYFLGAMFISYAMMVPPALIGALAIWHLSNWQFDVVFLATFLVFLPLAPWITRLARVVWIYIDRMVDPD